MLKSIGHVRYLHMCIFGYAEYTEAIDGRVAEYIKTSLGVGTCLLQIIADLEGLGSLYWQEQFAGNHK